MLLCHDDFKVIDEPDEKGAKALHKKTDIYVIGVLLHTLIKSCRPRTGLYAGPPTAASIGFVRNRAAVAKQKEVLLQPILRAHEVSVVPLAAVM